MTKAGAARKLASAAVYGGGGVSMLGAGIYGVLRAEAAWARARIGNADRVTPDSTGWYGHHQSGPALRIAVLGDSTSVGYGVDRAEHTTGARLAAGVAEGGRRKVHLRSYGMVGAKSSDLGDQVARALIVPPDAAVILVGANDVTHRVRPSESVRHLVEAVTRLREAGVEVIVGTCPDLGTVQPIAPPLKQLAQSWSRRIAAAQTIGVVEAGGRTVSLAEVLGDRFLTDPKTFFGADRFHPSAVGYQALAGSLVPSTLVALGLAPETEPVSARGEAVMPIASAAIQAVDTAGTELGGTSVGGSRSGVRGLWVTLRHRIRQTGVADEAPNESEDPRTVESEPPAPDPALK
ncbi:MAG: SGNH/GDSL hydrolase family protein [Nocardioides sp.]